MSAVSNVEQSRVADSVESNVLSEHRCHTKLQDDAEIDWVRHPKDRSILHDHKGFPISVDRILSTKPLRCDLSTRPGPGNKKLTYLSGEGVTSALNEIFGFDGWNLDIVKTHREESIKDDKGRHSVFYTAQVRLTHKRSGTYKEDCGAGDAVDRSFGTAVAHAMKGAITDAMKRAARHFGNKLGNSLYQGKFSINKAPLTLKDALDMCDKERAESKFGVCSNLEYDTKKGNVNGRGRTVPQTVKSSVLQTKSSTGASACSDSLSLVPLNAPPTVSSKVLDNVNMHACQSSIESAIQDSVDVMSRSHSKSQYQAPPAAVRRPRVSLDEYSVTNQVNLGNDGTKQIAPPLTSSQGLQLSRTFGQNKENFPLRKENCMKTNTGALPNPQGATKRSVGQQGTTFQATKRQCTNPYLNT